MGLTYRFGANKASQESQPNTKTGWFLKPIFFGFDANTITNDQRAGLDADLAVLKAHPDLYILVGGHSDEKGDKQYNLELSEKRAQTVQNYLTTQGIDPARITVYAYGVDYPIKGANSSNWKSQRWVDIVLLEAMPQKEQGIRTSSQQ